MRAATAARAVARAILGGRGAVSSSHVGAKFIGQLVRIEEVHDGLAELGPSDTLLGAVRPAPGVAVLLKMTEVKIKAFIVGADFSGKVRFAVFFDFAIVEQVERVIADVETDLREAKESSGHVK